MVRFARESFAAFSGVAGLRGPLPLCFRSAELTRRSAGGAGGGSLLQAVTLQVYQLLDPAREVPAEAVHVELCVDIRAARQPQIGPQIFAA